MYPFVNVVIGWLAAAVKGRVLLMVGILCATTAAAAILAIGVSEASLDDSISPLVSLPVIVLMSSCAAAMDAQPPAARFGWPERTRYPHVLSRQRVIGGTILFLAAAVGGLIVSPMLWPMHVLALAWAAGFIGIPAVIVCLWLLILEHRQRAALQREAKQD